MKVKIPAKFQAALETLSSCGEGRFAAIKGYSPSTNYIERPIVNVTFNSRFSTMRFYQRMLDKLNILTVADFCSEENEKVLATFDTAKAEMKASYEKTLAGDRSDAHRQGHDRCYQVMDNGVKLHLKTEKGADGLMVPVLDDEGNAMAESIMLSGLEISRKYVKEGKYKEVKSQSKTIMKTMIENKIGANKFKMFSLKEDNFESVAIDNLSLQAEEVF